MGKQAMSRVVGAMISYAFTIASWSLDAAQVSEVGGIHPPWRWAGVVSFSVFSFLVAWGWYSEYRQRQKLSDLRPSVAVVPHREGHKAWFTITNTGEHTADFEVRVHLARTDRGQLAFRGKWRGARDAPNISLKADGEAELDLVQAHGRNDGMESLNVFTATETIGALAPVGSCLHCTITVLSEPKLKRPFVQMYTLVLREGGDWAKFEEAPHRVRSH